MSQAHADVELTRNPNDKNPFHKKIQKCISNEEKKKK